MMNGYHFGPPWWMMLFGAIVITCVITIFLTVIIRGVSTWQSNNASPVLTLSARVIGRRTETSGGGHDTSVRSEYYLTFELENGERKEFQVSGQQYGLIVEGDVGMVTFQGTRFYSFERRPVST